MTIKCLTSFFIIISAAIDVDELLLIVIIGVDSISLQITALVGPSLIHTFVIISRSVTIHKGVPFVSTTTKEVTSLSFIFFATSHPERYIGKKKSAQVTDF